MRYMKALSIYVLLALLTAVPAGAQINSNNILANPGFEYGINLPMNWSFVTNNGNTPIWDTASHSGARSVKISIDGTSNSRSGYPRSDMIKVEPLQRYILSVWVKTQNAGGLNAPAVRVNEFAARGNWIRQTSLVFNLGTNDWTQKQLTFRTNTNTTWISVYANIWDGYGTFWVDDVILIGPVIVSDISLNGGGTISSLAINPASPNIVYATADLSGVYKSYDYGKTWSHSRGGLNTLADWTVAAIAVNPRNPNNLFIGSGEVWDHPAGNYGGLFRSDDGGKNWKLVTRDLKFSGHGDYRQFGDGLIVFDPKNAYTIYAATAWDGIFKSTDGGNTWVNKGLSGYYLTAIAINDTGTIYVSAGKRNAQNGGIFKSTDGGETWVTLNSSISAQKMVVKGSTIYVASKGTGIYKSINGGYTWQLKNNGLSVSVRNFVSVAMDSTNPSILYVVSKEWDNNEISLYKTADGGDKWTIIPNDVAKNVTTNGWWKSPAWFSSGSYSLYVDPVNPLRVYLTDSYTVWRSTDGGTTWETTALGLETSAVSDIKLHPSIPNLLMVATKDITGFISYDGANTTRNLWGWGDGQLMISNLYAIAFDPKKTNPSSATIFVVSGNATSGDLWKSIDSGKTWIKQTGLPNTKKYIGIAVDPIYPTNIYVNVGGDSIYKTIDDGAFWSKLPLPAVTNIIRLEINPLQTSTIYILDEYKGVFKSTNGGADWTQYNTGFSPNLGVYYEFSCLAIDPKNPQILYAGGEQDGIYKSTDGGTSWHQIFADFSCGSIAVDPNNNLNVFAGSRSDWWYRPEIKKGIYQSGDGGNTWIRIDDDVTESPLASISSLAVDPFQKGTLYVGTNGGGSYKLRIS